MIVTANFPITVTSLIILLFNSELYNSRTLCDMIKPDQEGNKYIIAANLKGT